MQANALLYSAVPSAYYGMPKHRFLIYLTDLSVISPNMQMKLVDWFNIMALSTLKVYPNYMFMLSEL